MSAHLTVLLKAASVLLKSTLAGKHFRTFSLLQKKIVLALLMHWDLHNVYAWSPELPLSINQSINQSFFRHKAH